MIKKITAKSIAYLLFGFIILLLMLGVFSSCNSVNKTRSSEHLKEDSNSVHKVDSTVHSFIDSLVEETKINNSDKTTIEDAENYINIEFDTTNYNKQPQTKTELTISDSAGVKKITSNKPLKSVSETIKNSSTKKDVQNSLATTKLEVNKVDSSSKNLFDSSSVKKELKVVNTTKEKHSSYWWLWLLLAIIAVYFTCKYLYKQNKLPLSLWLAKALFFV